MFLWNWQVTISLRTQLHHLKGQLYACQMFFIILSMFSMQLHSVHENCVYKHFRVSLSYLSAFLFVGPPIKISMQQRVEKCSYFIILSFYPYSVHAGQGKVVWSSRFIRGKDEQSLLWVHETCSRYLFDLVAIHILIFVYVYYSNLLESNISSLVH